MSSTEIKIQVMHKMGLIPLKEIGLILYWCEGSKMDDKRYGDRVEFVSSDQRMHQLFVQFLVLEYGVQKIQIVGRLAIHEKQNEEEIKQKWSKLLGITKFHKTTIKKSRRKRKNLELGTLTIRVYDSKLYRQIIRDLESFIAF